jgi:aspartyl-tRNA(Asn)/glutamyl-tRNA(Gln) amidotransferase subunit A
MTSCPDTKGLEGMRFGVPRRYFFDGVEPDIFARVTAAAEVFADLGAVVQEVDLRGAETALEAGLLIAKAEAYALHERRLARQPDLFDDDVRARLLLGQEVSGFQYARARQTVRTWHSRVARVFSRVDMLLMPTTPAVAPFVSSASLLRTTSELVRFTYPWSVAGVPALTVPCGFSKSGLPVGMQLVGPAFSENLLFGAACTYQSETEWHLRSPNYAPDRIRSLS